MSEQNKELPVLSFWLARSTYAMILVAVTTLAAAFNIDLLAHFGTSEDKLLKAVDAVLPLAGAAWLWWERHNPHFKIGI